MKLTVTTFTSIDGVMQSPGAPEEDPSNGFDLGGWLVPFANDNGEMGEIVTEQFSTADAFLLGRGTFELFKAYWPNVEDPNDPVASKLRDKPKYVVSDTMTESDWAGSHFIKGKDAVGEIEKLKAQPGADLQVHGSWKLAQVLAANDLVDEYRLWVYPVILGKGKRLFETGFTPTAFERADTRFTSTGVTMHVYKPTGKASFGAFALEDGEEVTRA
jgi:dihydrofolate reductase